MDRERQLDEQLIQCKARIAMLEDLNRDYKNTINLLRSELEIKNVGMANHNQGHHCCSQTQPTKESQIETKIEGLLDKFKHEVEIRDMIFILYLLAWIYNLLRHILTIIDFFHTDISVNF
jgi:hypothetical protein